MFGSFGLPEILAILAIAIFLFGARKIPDLARGLGEGIRNFKTSLRGEGSDGADGADAADDADDADRPEAPAKKRSEV